jgi:5-methyltetrahydropteroyltriglutamate--homocysteine methyltransferase
VPANRILTTHAGSLPRPPALVELYARRQKGEAVDETLLAAEGAAATRWVLERQREAGINIAGNGEQLREGFFIYLARRLSGFGGAAPRKPWGDLGRYPEFAAQSGAMFAAKTMVSNRAPPAAVAEVRHAAPEANEAELRVFEEALAEMGDGFADRFMTAPSPGVVVAAMQNRFYPDRHAYLDAAAAAMRVEYEAAVRHGLMLQIDAPDLAMERHISFVDEPLEAYLEFVADVVAAMNKALLGLPPERVRLHVCWGNYEGPHDLDVELAEVLPILLRANVGGLVLPFANPRHQHEIKVLRDLPLRSGQYLVAGCIDTLTNFVEHPEVVAERLERAAEAVGDPARVMAGTDCGFDTAAGMGRVTSDVVWAKLNSLSEGAALASRRLF